MPLEGHYQRQQTSLHRLTPRERMVGLVLVGLLVVIGVATAIAAVGNDRVAPNTAGCVAVVDPGTMGGAMSRACGAKARAFCQTPRAHSDTTFGHQLTQACRKAGY